VGNGNLLFGSFADLLCEQNMVVSDCSFSALEKPSKAVVTFSFLVRVRFLSNISIHTNVSISSVTTTTLSGNNLSRRLVTDENIEGHLKNVLIRDGYAGAVHCQALC
jgi:hypothetical protein